MFTKTLYDLLLASRLYATKALAGALPFLPGKGASGGEQRDKINGGYYPWEDSFLASLFVEPVHLGWPKLRAFGGFCGASPGLIINILLITFQVTKNGG
ncbi:MAG: hypothetical protein KDD10_07620 [Phaeodactylibacter sp.]|nr:hypothetical protein [Phaeodactylibacter sp.]